MGQRSTLSEAFLEDHRHLTQGLSATLAALETGDLATAVKAADDLDRRAGPHIRFEEEFFYPQVARSRGQDYVSRLLTEHEAGRRAIRELLTRGADGRLTPADTARIVSGLREALDHAVSCGTLLSHVTTLEPNAQKEYLDRLLQLRATGGRWTSSPSEEGRHSPADS